MDRPTPPLTRVAIRDFRCIAELSANLSHPQSLLGGAWTCIAGINGAGKTSVLQAIALASLGQGAMELGLSRLVRFRRRGTDIHTRMNLSDGAAWLKLTEKGIVEGGDGRRLPILVGYGASRNLSEFDERRWASASVPTQRVVSLFDPLTQIVSASALLERIEDSAGWVLLATLLERLPLPIRVVTADGARWLDKRAAASTPSFQTGDGLLPVTDLPDGYRSTLAWLADLCLQHGAAHPEVRELADVEAVVLVDEIDLHLHPSLQRTLVPALRAALPRVQWIVTTHSPLVLSCFDRHEIIALDRDAPGGIRELDRQILGASPDDIYRWLMDTPPSGGAFEAFARERPAEAEALLRVSDSVDDARATTLTEAHRHQLAQVLGQK